MAYSKQTWDTTSYVNPTRMNHIEDGIEANDQRFITVITQSYTVTVGANADVLVEITDSLPSTTQYKLISAYVYIERMTGSWHAHGYYNPSITRAMIRNYGTSSNDITFSVCFLYEKR